LAAIQQGICACSNDGNAQPTLIYSEASSSTGNGSWGGARNRADRTSEHIKLGAALGLVEAARHALRAGMPFNRHLTVHWGMGGIEDHEAAKATGKLTKLIGDWVRKRGGRFANAWVREMGARKGSHAHLLLHIPEGIHLGHMTRRWVGGIVRVTPPKLVLTRPIGGVTRAAFSGSDWYEDNLAAVVSYLLKGVDPTTGETFGLDDFGMGGRIIGKRVSISQNLRQARRGTGNPCALHSGHRYRSNLCASTVGPSTPGRGSPNRCAFQSGQRPESSVTSLTPFFSGASRARARARPEPRNQNFADDLGKSGEAA